MTTQQNWENPRKAMKAAERTDLTNKNQTNWDGVRQTRSQPRLTSTPQTNFQGVMSIPDRDEPGQGQKSGTGNNDGY